MTGSLELKAVHQIGEPACLARVSRSMTWKLVHSRGVTWSRAGRISYIPLSEIRGRIPGSFRSRCSVEEGRRLGSRAQRA